MCFGLALAAEQIEVPSSGQIEVPSSGQIKKPIGEQTLSSNLQLPGRSMTKDMVRQSFGEPVAIEAEVGEPPISAWQYENFVVYFEQQWVLHAVVKHPDYTQAD